MSIEPAYPPAAKPFANLTTLVPDWDVCSRVTAFCTTRLGGVSKPPFDSLNFGLHVGDDESHVRENRRRLEDAMALPAPPVWLNQTHGTQLIQLPDSQAQSIVQSADGAWTTRSDTVLAVMTADCLPVIISDRQGSCVAVVHAGWRGLANGILGNALAHFDESLELHAWLGPAIGPQRFEVGEEVREAFITRLDEHHRAFAQAGQSGKYLADLYALARGELNSHRKVIITGGQYCTHTQQQWFHSHRRDGKHSGRMATVAWISGSR